VLAHLRRETEGVPLLLVEYLRGLAAGTVQPSDEQWEPGDSVHQLLEGRLSAVSETSRQLLSAAAVIGRSFDFDVLRVASGRGEDETVTALEELSRLGLVRELSIPGVGGELQYDFTHDKLRALAYADTSLARRRLLHRRVAEALASRSKSRSELEAQPELIAHHYLQAGDLAMAADYERIAGERARRLYAHSEAIRHYATAVALGYPDAAALHTAIGDLQTMLGEYRQAIASYESAAALADANLLPSIEHRLGMVYARRGEWELAESHLTAALEALGAEDAAQERASIFADWSLLEYHRERIEQSLELARRALELAERAEDAAALAQAHNMLGILATRSGELTIAREHLERSLAVAERLGDLGARMAALNNLALALGAGGESTRALEHAAAALALSRTQGDRHREAALHNNLADLLHAAGRSEEAVAHVREAVTIYAEIGVEAGALQPAIWKLSEW
jgi:tetratricopeptide (TPR) repeat protein